MASVSLVLVFKRYSVPLVVSILFCCSLFVVNVHFISTSLDSDKLQSVTPTFENSISAKNESHLDPDFDGQITLSISSHSIECLQRVISYSDSLQGICHDFTSPHVFEKSQTIALVPAKTGSYLFKNKLIGPINDSLPTNHKLYDLWHHARLTYSKNDNNSKYIVIGDSSFHEYWNIIHTNDVLNYAATYFCDKRIKKIFIYRDPIERLVSGYLDKCTESTRKYCINWEVNGWQVCAPFLLYIGIDMRRCGDATFERMIRENKLLMAQVTLGNFVKWLLDQYKCGLNSHFRNYRLFADLIYFHNDWEYMHLKHEDSWDYLIKSIIDKEYYGLWNRQKRKIWKGSDGEKSMKVRHDTGASEKQLFLFKDLDTLMLSLEFTWMDYDLFDWKLPEWICDIITLYNVSETNQIVNFIKIKLKDKHNLWPECIRNTL